MEDKTNKVIVPLILIGIGASLLAWHPFCGATIAGLVIGAYGITHLVHYNLK